MSPLVHGMIAWLFAVLILKKTGDRRLAVIAGVALDIDGVFILFDMGSYLEYHHALCHSLVFGIPLALAAAILGEQKIRTGVACLGAFTLHIIADVVGTNWPVYPFYPFSDWGISVSPTLTHYVIYGVIGPAAFILCCILILIVMWKKDVSPLEFFSVKWDKRFVHSFTYFFKKRCEICGKRAFGECSDCGEVICSEHLGSMIRFRCRLCQKIIIK